MLSMTIQMIDLIENCHAHSRRVMHRFEIKAKLDFQPGLVAMSGLGRAPSFLAAHPLAMGP
jgi:hypothetical protein